MRKRLHHDLLSDVLGRPRPVKRNAEAATPPQAASAPTAQVGRGAQRDPQAMQQCTSYPERVHSSWCSERACAKLRASSLSCCAFLAPATARNNTVTHTPLAVVQALTSSAISGTSKWDTKRQFPWLVSSLLSHIFLVSASHPLNSKRSPVRTAQSTLALCGGS